VDPRVLGQEVFWVERGAVLRLDAMPEADLLAVAQMLRGRAKLLHFWELVGALEDLRESERTGVPSGDALAFAVSGGSSLADVDPIVWLESTPLMRAISRRLAGSG
jgi:hypothetical protein